MPHFENPMRIIKLSKKTERCIGWFEVLCFDDESHDNIKTHSRDLQYLILYNSIFTDLNTIVKYLLTNIVLFFEYIQNQFLRIVGKRRVFRNFVSNSSNFKIIENLFSFN